MTLEKLKEYIERRISHLKNEKNIEHKLAIIELEAVLRLINESIK